MPLSNTMVAYQPDNPADYPPDIRELISGINTADIADPAVEAEYRKNILAQMRDSFQHINLPLTEEINGLLNDLSVKELLAYAEVLEELEIVRDSYDDIQIGEAKHQASNAKSALDAMKAIGYSPKLTEILRSRLEGMISILLERSKMRKRISIVAQ